MGDIEIARSVTLKPIEEVAKKAGIEKDELECYGKYKAKLSDELCKRVSKNKNGKLILVTAINPTPLGQEEKPTNTIQGMRTNYQITNSVETEEKEETTIQEKIEQINHAVVGISKIKNT